MSRIFATTGALSLLVSMSFVQAASAAENAPAAEPTINSQSGVTATETISNTQLAVPAAEPSTNGAVPTGTNSTPASKAQDNGLGFLKEMVVSANKEKPVQERTELGKLTASTPMSGSTISSEELENVRFVDPRREMLRRVPGFTMIRNIRIPDGGKSYTDKRVDGMRVDNSGNFQVLNETNPVDIERVEVITGPGSVLNSSSAYGGTINVITRDPPAKTQRKLTQEVGVRDYYRTDISQGGTTGGGVGYMVDANYMNNHGWQKSTSEKKKAASGKVVLHPQDQSKLTLRVEYLNDDYLSPGTLTEAQFNADWKQSAPGSYSRSDITYITPSMQYKQIVGDKGELNVSLSSRRNDSTSYSANSASSNKLTDSVATDTGIQAMYRQDLDFALSSVYVGLDVMNTNSESKAYTNASTYANALQGVFTRGAMTGDSVSKEANTSPFIHYEFSPLDRFRLSLGTRFDKIEYTIDDKLSTKDGNHTFTKNIKKVGATFDVSDNNLIWARAGEGFLAPSVSTMLGSFAPTPATHAAAVTSKYIPTDMTLKPEQSMTYEIGLRGKLSTQDLNYDLALYSTDIKDLVVQQDCGATELCYRRNVNAGKANLKGLESALMYAATDWLDINLAYTYSRVRYVDYITPTVNYNGNTWKNAPTQHYNLRLSFKPAPGLRAELVADHMSHYFLNNENEGGTYQRPDMFDLRTSYRYEAWTAWVHVLNLLDTKYGERVQKTAGNNPRTYGDGYNPRNLRAGVSYDF